MFKWIGRLTTNHPWVVCCAWLVVGFLLSCFAPPWDTKAQDDDIRFLPDRCPSVRGYLLLQKAFPREVFASRAIFGIERTGQTLTPADYALADDCVRELNALRNEDPSLQIGKIASYNDPFIGKRLISADRRCTLIQVALGTPFLALQTRATVDRAEHRLRQRLASAGTDAPSLLVTGPAGLGRDLTRASAGSLDGTTLATILLVVVVLMLVYRAPLLALVPLITIGISVWVSLKLLALLTLIPGVHLVNISKVFAIVILYGAGTDYCLFLISRYREELSHTWDSRVALRRSLVGVGGALCASAGTVVCGLGLMGFAEFAKVRCAGPAIALSLAVALLASLTVTPALLHAFGRWVFWPSTRPSVRSQTILRPSAERDGFWDRISCVVVARPAAVWIIAVLLLCPLVALGLRVSPNYRSTGELPPTSQSILGVQAIQRHFTAGEIGPLTVLLVSPTDWNSPAGKEVIGHLTRGFGLLPNVAEVRSFTQPLGPAASSPTPLPEGRKLFGGLLQSIGNLSGLTEQINQTVRELYLASVATDAGTRFVTRVDVVFKSDPFDRQSMKTMELIQTWLTDEMPRSARVLGKVDAECYGVTVNARDLAEVTEADRCRVNLLVLSGIFLILLVLVRKPWLAAYLLATVLFSYYATLGATVLAGMLYSARPLDQVEWRVPFFLFTILIAVGEDYNILLITRVLAERHRRGAAEGTRQAIARTGGTITSCGLIMAGTFATLMLAGLGTLVQIGFALAFGVLLDTFIVRPFLVPAFTLLVWREETPPPPVQTWIDPSHSRLAG